VKQLIASDGMRGKISSRSAREDSPPSEMGWRAGTYLQQVPPFGQRIAPPRAHKCGPGATRPLSAQPPQGPRGIFGVNRLPCNLDHPPAKRTECRTGSPAACERPRWGGGELQAVAGRGVGCPIEGSRIDQFVQPTAPVDFCSPIPQAASTAGRPARSSSTARQGSENAKLAPRRMPHGQIFNGPFLWPDCDRYPARRSSRGPGPFGGFGRSRAPLSGPANRGCRGS